MAVNQWNNDAFNKGLNRIIPTNSFFYFLDF